MYENRNESSKGDTAFSNANAMPFLTSLFDFRICEIWCSPGLGMLSCSSRSFEEELPW